MRVSRERSLPDPARLMLLGNIPVDLVMRVPGLPQPGDDLLAETSVALPGGGFHVLDAAWRGGLRGRYAGTHGVGPFGDAVRAALARIDCSMDLTALEEWDSGCVVALVDGTGERTFVSSPNAVLPYTTEVLASLQPRPSDLVYVSGYSLGLGEASAPLAAWVDDLGPDHVVFCDLGPWGAAATPEILDPVLRRVDWLSCNAREAALLVGQHDPAIACAALQRRTRDAGVLVRVGAEGCWLAMPGCAPELVPPAPVADVVDTTGAGDTHSGTFLAALAAGKPAREAVALANAAAAAAVTLPGGASWVARDGDPRSGREV